MTLADLACLLLIVWGGSTFYRQVHTLNQLAPRTPYRERLAHAAALAAALGAVLFAAGDRWLDALCVQLVAVILHRILHHATSDRAAAGRCPGPL